MCIWFLGGNKLTPDLSSFHIGVTFLCKTLETLIIEPTTSISSYKELEKAL